MKGLPNIFGGCSLSLCSADCGKVRDVSIMLNKSDARFLMKCPWAVDLQNTAWLSATASRG